MIGTKLGNLTVVKLAHRSHRGESWLLVCDCGNEIKFTKTQIENRERNSCGDCVPLKGTRKWAESKFHTLYTKEGKSSCWIWKGATDCDGYGVFGGGGYFSRKAHRASYQINIGDISPTTLQVLHECDNPSCVNPVHLFLGTQQNNIQDMVQKGRNRHPRGEESGAAKLTEKQVKEIRKSYGSPTYLANKYKVSVTHIHRIRSRKVWKHVS